jgi:hypothetical protein
MTYLPQCLYLVKVDAHLHIVETYSHACLTAQRQRVLFPRAWITIHRYLRDKYDNEGALERPFSPETCTPDGDL